MSYEYLMFEREGNVGVIKFNRPKALNAVNPEVFRDLKDALDGCERILNDEFSDYPERSFYMIGKIEEAKKG